MRDINFPVFPKCGIFGGYSVDQLLDYARRTAELNPDIKANDKNIQSVIDRINNRENEMSFAFATCERHRALGFLKKLYPSHALEDTFESVKDLLDIIEADEIRVCDPDYHVGSIIQSSNWKDDTASRTKAALEKSGLPFGAT